MAAIKEDLTFLAKSYFGESAVVLNDDPYVLEVSGTEIRLGRTNLHARELLRLISLGGPGMMTESVVVARQPRAHARASVMVRSLTKFRHDFESGGMRQSHEFAALYATISCSEIPAEVRPRLHSCTHGPAPHHIKVCIVDATERLWDVLTQMAIWSPHAADGAFKAFKRAGELPVSIILDRAIAALQQGAPGAAAALLEQTREHAALPDPLFGYLTQVGDDIAQGRRYAAIEALREAIHWVGDDV